MNQNIEESKRRYLRLKTQIQVDYTLDDEVELLYSTNISEGGLFLETVNPFPPGTKLLLRFNLPDSDKIIEVVGEVVYKVEEIFDIEEWDLPGMGIRFMAVNPEDAKLIREFIENRKTN
jgi:uncharacterized protein (TIGR02266 family)